MNGISSFDALTRRVLLVLGFVTLALGMVTYVVVQPLVGVLPSSYALVVATGGIAFLTGLWLIRSRTSKGVQQTQVPDIELPISTQAPGNDVDKALYRLTRYRQGTVEYKDQIQKRLASVAVDVIRQRDDCSHAEAVNKLKEGTWTANPFAKSFFAGGSPPSRSLVESLSDRFFGKTESDYERWVRMTVDTLVDRAGLEQADTPDSTEEANDASVLEQLRSQFQSGGGSPQSASNYQDVMTDDDATEVREGVMYGDLLDTGHWRGITAFVLIAAGWGILTTTPSILLISAVGVAINGYARMNIEPPVSDLEIERHVSEETPDPGETVDVTVTVHNTGDTFMPDLRLIDRVPPSMTVIDGSARLATALGSDAKATFSYTTVAERGSHEWPLLVIARDFSGTFEREAAIEVNVGIECIPTLNHTHDAPVRSQTSLYSGQVDTSMGGSGLEFFSIREYREGDPMKRIDWKRRARTGELATINFRQERAAKVVLLFDSRESAYVSPQPQDRHAVNRSVDAAIELFAALFDRGDLVGIAAYDTVPCWQAPGAGEENRERARHLFADHPAISTLPPDLKDVGGTYIDPMTHIRRQLTPEAQIMLFSPLCDDYTAEVARRLDSVGHPITIISPDPTSNTTVGKRLARVERTMRITNLREHGIRIINWQPDEPIGIELERAKQRWAV